MTASQSQSQSHCSDVDHLTLLLLNSRLVEDGELWFPQIKLLIMCPVVQLQSIICVHEILFCLVPDSVNNCNPIEEHGSISLILFVGYLVLPLFLFFSTILDSTQVLCVVTSNMMMSVPLIIIAMFAIFFFFFFFIPIFENRRQVCIIKF